MLSFLDDSYSQVLHLHPTLGFLRLSLYSALHVASLYHNSFVI